MPITFQAVFKDRFRVVGTNSVGAEWSCSPGLFFPNQPVTFAAGTASYQINAATMITTIVTAANTRTIDLSGLIAFDGSAMALSQVKTLAAAVTASGTTDTNPAFLMGPLGIANGAILGFGGTTGAAEVRTGGTMMFAAITGWAVTATNKLLILSAPGAFNVTANVLICGRT